MVQLWQQKVTPVFFFLQPTNLCCFNENMSIYDLPLGVPETLFSKEHLVANDVRSDKRVQIKGNSKILLTLCLA